MKRSYQKFLEKNIDISELGVFTKIDFPNYFCTPKGAEIFGSAGVDGIHFCFVKGFRETVFAISPMNIGDYVHPVARSFYDFLRLLISCGDSAAIEQAYAWDRPQFEAFLQDNPILPEAQDTINIIMQKMDLSPMEDPFSYIKQLQAEFDYSKIKFTDEYYEFVMPEPDIPDIKEWKVYFDGDFLYHEGHDRAGKEISIGKKFEWGEYSCAIPSVYICGKGLVFDLLIHVCSDKIKEFSKYEGISDDDLEMFNIKSPFEFDICVCAEVNGKKINRFCAHSVYWNPNEKGNSSAEAKAALEHYGFDKNEGWIIQRISFNWATKRRPEIKSIRINFSEDPIWLRGPFFSVKSAGDKFEFVNPLTDVKHTLTVEEYEPRNKPLQNPPDMELPNCCVMMRYTISPDLDSKLFRISDCAKSDKPKIISKSCDFVSTIAIIGGADGPTAIIFSPKNAPEKSDNIKTACSSLHFKPVKQVKWRIIFCKKELDDISVELI